MTNKLNSTNIVPFQSRNNIKFITTSVWIDYIIDSKGEVLEKRQVAVIALKNKDAEVDVIHPVSDFILKKYGHRKYNTQRKHANNLMSFLNYLLTNRKWSNIDCLEELQLSHVNQFLNKLTSEGKSRETVYGADKTLTYFYKWLSDEGCLPNVPPELFEQKKRKNQHGLIYYESIFEYLKPSNIGIVKEQSLPIKYIPLLMEIATIVAKPIALGIYFQIFGGLRSGEVVNIKRTQVTRNIKSNDFIVDLQSRHFRSDINDSSGSSYVKKPRKQQIYMIYDWGKALYKEHIELYKPTDNSNALFVNRDGKAMSGKSYRQYFDKTKRYFINFLADYGDLEARQLASKLRIRRWSTHIGRGTFTNFIAENTENPIEVMYARGDKSIFSSLPYLARTERLRKKMEEKFQHMQGTYIPNLIERRNEEK